MTQFYVFMYNAEQNLLSISKIGHEAVLSITISNAKVRTKECLLLGMGKIEHKVILIVCIDTLNMTQDRPFMVLSSKY